MQPVWLLVLDTFKNQSAERVPSECSQSRYIADIFNKDISRASPDILPIYFTKICFRTSKACGSKQVNQRGSHIMMTKAEIVFKTIFCFCRHYPLCSALLKLIARAEQKNLGAAGSKRWHRRLVQMLICSFCYSYLFVFICSAMNINALQLNVMCCKLQHKVPKLSGSKCPEWIRYIAIYLDLPSECDIWHPD